MMLSLKLLMNLIIVKYGFFMVDEQNNTDNAVALIGSSMEKFDRKSEKLIKNTLATLVKFYKINVN